MLCNEGLKGLILLLIDLGPIEMHVRLFANDITPDENTEATDLTEATFSGYEDILLAAPTWTDPDVDVDGHVRTESDTLTFECDSAPGSPETIYGLYVTIDSAFLITQKLLFAHRFSSEIVIADVGDKVEKVLRFLSDELVP